MKVEKVDRLCIGVPNLEEVKSLMEKIFGIAFEFVGDVSMPDKTLMKAAISNQGIELLEVPGKEVHMRSFHFKVNNLDEAKEWVKQHDIKILSEFSVGKMDEVVLDVCGLRTVMINYPGTDPAAAAKG